MESSPDGQPVLISLLADVHPLQLGHVPQVVALHLLQPVVILLVGEVNVPLPLQAVDLQREGAADAADAFALLAALGPQVLLLRGRMVKRMKQIAKKNPDLLLCYLHFMHWTDSDASSPRD